MNALLYFITFGPLAAYLVVLAIPSRSEKALSRWTVGAALAHLAAILAATAVWLVRGRTPWTDLNIRLYETDGYQFIAAIHLDSLAAVFLLLGSALFTLIAAYSSVYMHREKGFARFFANIWFFYMGYTVTVVAGNFETLFAGWEILGVSSFLLIAFYRDRYVKHEGRWKIRYSQFHRLYEIVGELPPRESIQAHYLATHGYKHPGTDPLPPFPKVKSYRHETGVMPPFLDAK